MRYIIHKKLIPEKDYTSPALLEPYVEVLSPEEYRESSYPQSKGHPFPQVSSLATHCKAEFYRHHILGTLCIPEKSGPSGNEWSCRFYLNREKLLFLGSPKLICPFLNQIEENRAADLLTPAQVFTQYLVQLTGQDEEYLDQYEDNLDQQEDEIAEDVNEIPRHFDRFILQTRKELMILNRYYRQLFQMMQTLINIPGDMIDEESREMLRFLSGRMERLCSDTQNLREYSLQIRDMYQSRIDVRQNKVIQFLTIVTTIFMPLTLITGWYGMNFSGMPELGWPHGYKMVIFLSILIVIIEWIIFRKKKWL